MRGLALLLLLCAAPALADLYRWVDPQTGSVKFSSYPPPWYGDPALEKRAPRVEHIPAGREAPPVAPTAGLEEKPGARSAPPAAPDAQTPAAPLPSAAQIEAQRKAITESIERVLKGAERK